MKVHPGPETEMSLDDIVAKLQVYIDDKKKDPVEVTDANAFDDKENLGNTTTTTTTTKKKKKKKPLLSGHGSVDHGGHSFPWSKGPTGPTHASESNAPSSRESNGVIPRIALQVRRPRRASRASLVDTSPSGSDSLSTSSVASLTESDGDVSSAQSHRSNSESGHLSGSLDTTSTISISSGSSGEDSVNVLMRTNGARSAVELSGGVEASTANSASNNEKTTLEQMRGGLPQRRVYAFSRKSRMLGTYVRQRQRMRRRSVLGTMPEEAETDPSLYSVLTDVLETAGPSYASLSSCFPLLSTQSVLETPMGDAKFAVEIVNGLTDVGSYLMSEGKFDKAENFYKREIDVIAEDEVRGAYARVKLAHCYYMQMKKKEALECYEEAIEELQDLLGIEHEACAIAAFGLTKTVINIGFSYGNEEKLKAAQELLEAVVASRERKFGVGSEEVIPWVHLLAILLFKRGDTNEDFERAECCWRQILDHQTTKLGKYHHDTKQTAWRIAICMTWRHPTSGVGFLRRRGLYISALALTRRLALSSTVAICVAVVTAPVAVPAVVIGHLYKDVPKKFNEARTNLAYHKRLQNAKSGKFTPAPRRRGAYSNYFKVRTVGRH